jgi:hypothetical protein
MPAFDSPVIGWLLRCFLPSAFVIARCHTIVDAFVDSCFSRQLLSTATTAATAAATAALRFWEVVSGVPSNLGIKQFQLSLTIMLFAT